MSSSTIRACAWGLRTVWPQSIPAAWRSLAYANSPVTFGTASERFTTSPIRPSGSPVAVAPCNSLLLGSSNSAAVDRSRAEPASNSLLLGIGGSRCEAGCVEDLRVAGAATEISRQGLADLVVARCRVPREQIRGRDDQPGRAEAALHRARLSERLLHRMQLPFVGEALDRDDVVAVGLRRQHEARTDELAVEEHGARPAFALLASVLRAREAEALAQREEQALALADFRRARLAVDGQGELHARHLS